MKKLLSLLTFLLMIGGLFAQGANDYTKWRFSIEQEPGSNEATLVTKAITDEGWHGYSSVPADEFAGPLPTEFSYDDPSKFELVGAIEETGFHTHYDEYQEVDVTEFEHEGIFKQKIKINSTEDFVITGKISYMVCESGGMCVAGDKPFAFSVKGNKAVAKVEKVTEETPKVEEETTEETLDEATEETAIVIEDLVFWEYKIFETVEDKEYEIVLTPDFEDSVSIVDPKKVVITKSGDSPLEFTEFKSTDKGYTSTIKFEGKEEPGALLNINFNVNYKGAESNVEQELPIALASTVRLTKGNCEPKTYNGIGANNEVKKSYIELFIGAFLAGLIALLTPCVFPMIPMTVTFFMKGAESTSKAKGIRKALLFGFSIIGIYTIIGTIVAVLFGAAFANWLATHWVPNILFFLIFMVFAASFLGLFEIRLPSSMVNKADAQADKGGLTGIFFMALTLVLVSFSCTGPIVGSILISAAQGGVIEPMLGMFAFSFAIA
ncbi:cytochrome c biogenesis protein CcdA, partial [Lishizhenia sp.]|uniref:cytochrome c biogenesis protein CcdA n=1 Tax=Lishizhenia sp. TaxID=2497594 RepID=UPI00299F0785